MPFEPEPDRYAPYGKLIREKPYPKGRPVGSKNSKIQCVRCMALITPSQRVVHEQECLLRAYHKAERDPVHNVREP